MTHAEFRAELKSLGLSQRDLAGALGVATTTVNAWAVGKTTVPQYAVAWLAQRKTINDAGLAIIVTPHLPAPQSGRET
jgi:transcriptional regulator with XRE-family HTH domain